MDRKEDLGLKVELEPMEVRVECPEGPVECAQDSGEGAAPKELGRVLLLEDDLAFQEVIRDFLAENGYTVVPVKNGGEGVAQVLDGDFALVLCDLNMPGLPGDMFYRAVQRIRPDLCSRFVFMTGYRGDAKLNDYIKSIGCWVLKKPFPLDDLLALFVFTAERPLMESVCDWDTSTGAPVGCAPVTDAVPESVPVPPLPVVPRLIPQVSEQFSWLDDTSGRYRPKKSSSRWLDVTVIVAVVLGLQYLDENNSAAAGLAEYRALQTQWQELAPQLEKATAAHAEFDRQVATTTRNQSQQNARWTVALRGIALAINPAIELQEIQAQENSEDPGACQARIVGQASGEQPRMVADRFRQSIEGSLATDVDGRVVSTSMQQLEDAPAGSDGVARASFVIVVKVAPNGTIAMNKKEAR